jgi:hypothetical protein
MGQTYTFVALTADGRSPFLDVRVLDDGEDPADHARKLLADHRSCSRIEVWNGHVRLMVVGHDPADLGEVAPD